jgi:glycerol-3-phosphate cytidylyltransferase
MITINRPRIGFTCSTFDLLHAGHISMLEEAKLNCEYLICGLQSDPTIDRPEKNKPIQSLLERQLQLRAVRFVDEIVVYETEEDLLKILKLRPIDIRFVGSEYIDKEFTGKGYALGNMELFYNKRHHDFSSSELRERIIKDYIKRNTQ